MAVVVSKDIRNAIVSSQNNPVFKQAFADFSRACQVAQEAFIKIKNESADACGYDDRYKFTATIANPLTGLDDQAKKEMYLEMVEDYRSHLVSNLIAHLKTQNSCTDSQESAYISYLNGKAALLKKDEDPNSILLEKFRGFLTKIANGTLKSNSEKSNELKTKIDVLARAMSSKMSVSYEALKPIKSKVSLESKQGKRWRINNAQDFRLGNVQSAQEFLTYVLTLPEQEKTLVPYLEALSQHNSYKTLQGLQHFFGIVADSLQFLQEPMEKTRLYQEKLSQIEGQTSLEKKALISITLINAFRKGANQAPLVQAQVTSIAPKGPSSKHLAKQAVVRNILAMPPTMPAPPAAKPAEAKAPALPKQSPQIGVAPPLPPQVKAPIIPAQNGIVPPPPPPPQFKASKIPPQNGVVPPPPPPQVKQTTVMPPPQTSLKPVPAVQAPMVPAPAALPAQAAPIPPVAKRAVATKAKPKENRLMALIKKPFIGMKNLLMRLLQLFRGKKTK